MKFFFPFAHNFKSFIKYKFDGKYRNECSEFSEFSNYFKSKNSKERFIGMYLSKGNCKYCSAVQWLYISVSNIVLQ